MGVYNNDNGVLSPIAGRGNLDGVYRANGILGAKNLLKVPYHHSTGVEFPVGGSITHVGITYTHNADHSITANGTATGSSYCIFNRKQDWSEFDLYGKEVTLSVSPVSNSVFLQLYDTDNSRMVCRTDSSTGEVTFTFPAELKNNTSWNISINIPNGTTVNNVTYYPMLRLASDTDDTYQPYAMTNRMVTSVLNHKAPLITTGFDTNHFDELYLWYSEQGATVTVTGMVHATTAYDSWNGAEIVPQNTLPMAAGGNGNISGIALNTTNGGVAYVGTNTGTDLQLVKFDGVGWYRFSLSYVKESL